MSLQRFSHSTAFAFTGARVVFSRPLYMCIAAFPLMIALVLFGIGLNVGSYYIGAALQAALEFIFPTDETVWYQFAYYPLLILFWLVFLVSLSVMVYLLASVIASPFNALLAEKIMVEKRYMQPLRIGFIGYVKMSVRMIFIAILRAFILITISVGLFVLSFIPGVNIVTSYLGAMIISFDAADYALELKGFNLVGRFKTLKSLFPEYSGMALS